MIVEVLAFFLLRDELVEPSAPTAAHSDPAWQQRGVVVGLRFVNDWAVLLGNVVLFDFCRGLIFALIGTLGLRVYVGYVIDWERWLCGGDIGPLILQRLRALLVNAAMLDRFFVIVHASLFLAFLLFGCILWFARRAAFREYAWAMTALMYLGLSFHLLVPTVPPWMAANEFRAIPSVEHIAATIYKSAVPGLVAAFAINPVAAMPSLHAAFPALAALIAIGHFGWRGAAVGLYALSMWIAIVYLGENYMIDVVAGIALACAVFALARHRMRRQPDDRPGRVEPHRLAFACALVVLALGVEQLTVALRRPLAITPAFVTSELAGRSDKVTFYLGRLAYARGDFLAAQQNLRDALDELRDVRDRRDAQALLAASAFRLSDFRTTIATLEGRDKRPEDHNQLLLLASAYVEVGEYEKGMALLATGRARFPDDPEPVYWMTRYGFLYGRVDAERVREVAEQLTTMTSPKTTPLRLALQQLVREPVAAPLPGAETVPFVRAAAIQR